MAGSDDDIPKINPSEVETLIKKIEQSTLSEQDKRMITRLLRTLLYLVGMLQEKKITLLKLKEMVFGKKSEKMKREEDDKGEPKDELESRVQEGGKGGEIARRRRMKSRRGLKARSQEESLATGGIRHQTIPGRGKSIAVINNWAPAARARG